MIEIKPRGLEVPELDIDKLNNMRKIMINKEGINEFLDVLEFIVSTGNTVKEITSADSAGGKEIVLTEYIKLISPITALPKAITGISKVPAQLADVITSEEQQAIYDILNKAQVNDVNKEEWLKDHLDAILKLKELIFKWYVKKDE